MIVAVWVALAIAAGLPLLVAPVSARCSPAVATLGAAAVSVLAAASLLTTLALLAAALPVPGDALHTTDGQSDPVPAPLAALALVALLVLSARTIRTAWRELHALVLADRCLGAQGSALVLVEDSCPEAFALQGLRRSGVQVTTGMLAHLSPAERAAMLAHERAHLQGRHAWLRAAVTVAAAAHPGLRAAPGVVHAGCERWADEVAASEHGRTTVARSLSRAGLAVLSSAAPARALSFGCTSVPLRVQALLAERPRTHRVPALLVVVTLLVLLLTTGHAVADDLELWGW